MRVPAVDGGRDAMTAILFLLEAHQASRWHRVDAAECWFWHDGAPLALRVATAGGVETVVLGPDARAGQVPQGLVSPHAWQAAAPIGGWSLVSCTVAPAFDFAGFDLAPDGWSPDDGGPARFTTPADGS